MEEPARCLTCYYILDGLPGLRCPECGRIFDLNDPSSFTRKPPFVRWKYWLPGVLLTFGVGFALYIFTIYLAGFGWATTFVVPFCIGTLLGYACRVGKFVQVLLAIIVIVSVVCGLFTLHLVGVFCGLCLTGIALGPILIGSLCGAALRVALKRSKFDQRWYLPILLLLLALLTMTWATIERLVHMPLPVERVITTADIPAPLDRTWNAIMFYEQVSHRPPLIMRIALSHPLYTTGSIESVGDVRMCVYNKGRLAKQVTRREPEYLLAFRVVMQQEIENRSVVIKGGSFEFERIDANTTRVTLSTEYEPLLSPRWIWRPFEEFGVHTLHEHVLEGMRLKATAGQSEYVRSEDRP